MQVAGYKFSKIDEMKNLIISILTVLISTQCFSQGSEELVVDEAAKKIFTTTEMKGIEEMIKFVDGVVSDSTNVADINQAYHAYFEKYKSYVENGFLPALLKDSIKFKYLETIDKTAFDAIWRIDDFVRKIRYKDTLLTDIHGFKTLELNYMGKYLMYLKEIGKTDSRYAAFHETIEITGDFPVSATIYFPSHHHEYDFTLFKDRLWATVYLLNRGDPSEEKVERYLKKKDY
ncbi:hypothetical protein MASR2M47_02420 [Draconibacterium sp.]